MALVTLDVAKEHLKVGTSDNDSDIFRKSEEATGIVLDYCNSTAWWRAITPTWTEDNLPWQVQAAILLVLEDLHEHRTVDMDAIERLLVRTHDPALA